MREHYSHRTERARQKGLHYDNRERTQTQLQVITRKGQQTGYQKGLTANVQHVMPPKIITVASASASAYTINTKSCHMHMHSLALPIYAFQIM